MIALVKHRDVRLNVSNSNLGNKLFFFKFAAETITNVLDFKREAGLWHGVLTVSESSGTAGGLHN